MKKWIIALGICCLLIVASCSQTTPISSDEQASSFTMQDVLDRTIQQENTVDQKAFTLFIEQTSNIPEEEPVTVKVEINGKIAEDPFHLHGKGSVSLNGLPPIGDFDLEVELYVADEMLYVYENMFNNWIKGDHDQLNDLDIQLDDITHLFQLISVEPFIDNLIVTQTNEGFVFTLEELPETLQQQLIEQLPLVQALVHEDDIDDIEQLHYRFTVDQKTDNVQSIEMQWTIVSPAGNESATSNTIATIEFYDQNDAEPKEVPQDVMDQAIDASQFGF